MQKQSNKQTALYCRTAHDCDFGIENQKNNLVNYAKAHGYTNLVIYIDNGFSGVTLDRPAFKMLQADIKAGVVSTVIVKSVSRVARNCFVLEQWIDKTTDMGVEVISLTEPDLFRPAMITIEVMGLFGTYAPKGGVLK